MPNCPIYFYYFLLIVMSESSPSLINLHNLLASKHMTRNSKIVVLHEQFDGLLESTRCLGVVTLHVSRFVIKSP